MSAAETSKPHSSIARFRITKFQYLLFSIAAFSILALGFSAVSQSNATIKEAKVLSDVESPAASIIFTQRETLVYATRLAQWSNGGTPRRTVQIARNILAQRLAVIDTSGRSMGARARAPYWDVLKKTDALVAQSPPGVLPEELHRVINEKVSPLIDEILAQSRELIVSYQRSVDKEQIEIARKKADRNQLNLIYFYIFITSGGLFLLFNARSNFKNYRVARNTLEREQERLDRTLEELRKAEITVAELKDLNETKNAFISTVNHELRTPLTSIIGYIELIRELQATNPKADFVQYFDVLDRNAQILLHVVESILSISRLDSAQEPKALEKVSLNQIIDNAVFIMQPEIDTKEQKIHFKAEDELFVDGDAGQLNQIFINIIGNAHKFSPEKSDIEIYMDTAVIKDGAELARIRITDHGIGIPADDIENLATRFFRAKNTDSGQYPGTGLGLAIVRQLVELHHGTLSIESVLGEGTTITLLIPLFLTVEAKLIRERRGEVLGRSISSLEGATPLTIEAITHTIGGVIGFYGFENEGVEILQYSRSIAGREVSRNEFADEQQRLLTLLRDVSRRISGEDNE
jgi:signal transduction histidine kinase